jgi:hypothetical protein
MMVVLTLKDDDGNGTTYIFKLLKGLYNIPLLG